VNQLREFAAQTRALESDHEELLQQRQADQIELQRLRMQNKDYTQLLEENFMLRQQTAVMHRDVQASQTYGNDVEAKDGDEL
jgi:uncharacterized protein YjaZ